MAEKPLVISRGKKFPLVQPLSQGSVGVWKVSEEIRIPASEYRCGICGRKDCHECR